MIHFFSSMALLGLVVFSSADAALKSRKLTKKIDGQPVEVFVVSEDGKAPIAGWIALPVSGNYPAPGVSVSEFAASYGASLAVNANFFKEDTPGFQEPIGLVVHAHRMLSPPSAAWPTAGWIDTKLEWDQVSLEASIEYGKTSVPLCRFHSQAARGCASVWMNRIPENLKNSILVKGKAGGLLIGREVHETIAALPKGATIDAADSVTWALQWPGKRPPAGLKSVTIDVRLKGKRLGEKWRQVSEAVSGSHVFTSPPSLAGSSVSRPWAITRQPRTLIGVDRDGHPWVAVFDGRRESSQGISVPGAWNILQKEINAKWALNLDGGGSSTLIHDSTLVNKPSDGYPRAVAVGWGAR
jgi:hypothetical protein